VAGVSLSTDGGSVRCTNTQGVMQSWTPVRNRGGHMRSSIETTTLNIA
jgi:hypothetical protein